MSAKPPLPKQIPYIIANEGCERFSFYGMRNMLRDFLTLSLLTFIVSKTERSAEAKHIIHSFVFLVYFFPLLGGFLADRFFGKFNTILWFSLIYCAGHGCLALFDDSVTGVRVGLFLIALGAGGIKPLVASFVGDQFDATNKSRAKVVFDAFYWIINFGSFFASLLMPIVFRSAGASIAFGIPGILMLVATIVFWLGRHKYVRMPLTFTNPNAFMRVVRTALMTDDPQRGNAGRYLALTGVVLGAGAIALWPLGYLEDVIGLGLAIVLVIGFGGIGTSMQLERARGKHPDSSIEGVRAVLRVVVLFALVTPFHSLFDQKTSEWIRQGETMVMPDWTFDLTGQVGFQPSQMQLFNPLLVMILIPFNNLVLYPWLARRGWNPTPLRRMTAGILFSSFAWIAIACLQLLIDGGGQISILWQLVPYFLLTLGEVLVSATGLEFAYSQAPFEMKGVIMAFWNLATSIGNLWVLLVNSAIRNDAVLGKIDDTGLSQHAFLMFFFAGFAAIAAFAFWLYARRYTMLDNYRADEHPPGRAANLPTAIARDR